MSYIIPRIYRKRCIIARINPIMFALLGHAGIDDVNWRPTGSGAWACLCRLIELPSDLDHGRTHVSRRQCFVWSSGCRRAPRKKLAWKESLLLASIDVSKAEARTVVYFSLCPSADIHHRNISFGIIPFATRTMRGDIYTYCSFFYT